MGNSGGFFELRTIDMKNENPLVAHGISAAALRLENAEIVKVCIDCLDYVLKTIKKYFTID